jgi:hypothetical protein
MNPSASAKPEPWRSCYGYEVDSDLPLLFGRGPAFGGQRLRLTESADPPAVAGDPLIEWLPRPDNALHVRIHASEDSFDMWTDLEGWFHIDPASSSITVPVCDDTVRREERLWGLPVALCYMARGDRPIHAAAVEVAGRALVLGAPGRFGKTTLASAFHQAGYRVLSEDYTCCRPSDEPAVLPGPALLRVRRDSYERLDLEGTEPVIEEPGRMHLAIDRQHRGDGVTPVPLKGMVFLREGEEGSVLERIGVDEALPDLWALAFRFPTDEDRTRCFAALVALGSRVPVWNLYRPMRYERLQESVDAVISTCLA